MVPTVPSELSCPAEFAPGTWLPEEIARQWLAHCGKGVKIFRGSRLVSPEKIRIGDATQIDEGVRIFGGEGVTIGRHVHMAFDSSISGGGACVLGDFAGIGAGVRIVTGSEQVDAGGLTNPTVPSEWRTVRRGKVEVRAHAVIFTGTIILPDVVVGEGAVVAAGSVVHRSLKEWCIYAGQPLVQIGVREKKDVLNKAALLLNQ